MVQLVIKDAMTTDGRKKSVVCESGMISQIASEGDPLPEGDRIIDGNDLLLIPGLCNTHTHASMTLFRGIGEDRDLKSWLEEEIWPREAKMERRHLEAGMELACLEMIKTGTTLFNDMYFREGDLAGIVDKMGLRAILGEGFLDMFSPDKREEDIKSTERAIEGIEALGSDRVGYSIAPHSAYTVCREGLEWCRDKALEKEVTLHIHLSETENEVKEVNRKYGVSPFRYLEDVGLLGPHTIAAHCVHCDPEGIDLIKRSGCFVSHNPISNMKLSSGGPMPLKSMIDREVSVTIGTDGASSNNTLDMFVSMRAASLMAKHMWGVDSIRGEQFMEMGTSRGYEALGIEGGKIEEGCVADLILLDLNHHAMNPPNDQLSNVLFSATGEVVKFTIVGGRVLMEDGHVEGENDIIKRARIAAEELREI